MDFPNNTKVVFRKFKDGGGVIALFPEMPGTNGLYTCKSYQHSGRHRSCDPDMVIKFSTPAKEHEYLNLLNELTAIGYENIRVIKRCSAKHTNTRYKQIQTTKT